MKSEHTFFKPLTPKSDQHLFFPYNITPESLIRVMREENNHQINKLVIVKQFCQYLRKCMENSMENLHTDVRA